MMKFRKTSSSLRASRTGLKRMTACLASVAMLLSAQNPLLHGLHLFAPPLAAHADNPLLRSDDLSGAFTFGGSSFELPDEIGTVYDIPNTETDGIEGSYVHTLCRTTETDFVLTLNGGTITGSDNELLYVLSPGFAYSLTLSVAADTILSITATAAVSLDGESTLCLTGEAALSITGGSSSIQANALSLSDYHGKLTLSSNGVGDPLLALATPAFSTFPPVYQYQRASDGAFHVATNGSAVFPSDSDASMVYDCASPVAFCSPTVVSGLCGNYTDENTSFYLNLSGDTLNAELPLDVSSWIDDLPYDMTATITYCAELANGIEQLTVTLTGYYPNELYDKPICMTIPSTATVSESSYTVYPNGATLVAGNVSLEDYTIFEGTRNMELLSDSTLSLLDGYGFHAAFANTDVTDWFPNCPDGLRVFLSAELTEGAMEAKVIATGIPLVAVNEPIAVRIPDTALYTGDNTPVQGIARQEKEACWRIHKAFTLDSVCAVEYDSRYDRLPAANGSTPYYASDMDRNDIKEYILEIAGDDEDGAIGNTYLIERNPRGYVGLTLVDRDTQLFTETTIDSPEGNADYFFLTEFIQKPLVAGEDIVIGGESYAFPSEYNVYYTVPDVEDDAIKCESSLPHALLKTGENDYTLFLMGGTIDDSKGNPLEVQNFNAVLTLQINECTTIQCASVPVGVIGGRFVFKDENNCALSVIMTGEDTKCALEANELTVESGALNLDCFSCVVSKSPLQVPADGLSITAPCYSCDSGTGRHYYAAGSPFTTQYVHDMSNDFPYFGIVCMPFAYAAEGEGELSALPWTPAEETFRIDLAGGATFTDISDGTDITSLLVAPGGLPMGISATIGGTKAGQTFAQITIRTDGSIWDNMLEPIHYEILIPAIYAEEDCEVWLSQTEDRFIYISYNARTAHMDDNVEIIGKVGVPLESSRNVTISLTGDVFVTHSTEDDVASWFQGLPSGLSVHPMRFIFDGETTAEFIIDGTPAECIVASLSVQIPATALQSGLKLSSKRNGSLCAIDTFGIEPDCATQADARYNWLPLEDGTVETAIRNILSSSFEAEFADSRYYFAVDEDGNYLYFYPDADGDLLVGESTDRPGGEHFFFMGWYNTLDCGDDVIIGDYGYELPSDVDQTTHLFVPNNAGINNNFKFHTIDCSPFTEAVTITLNGGTIDSRESGTYALFISYFRPIPFIIDVAADTTLSAAQSEGLFTTQSLSITGTAKLTVVSEVNVLVAKNELDLTGFRGELVLACNTSKGVALKMLNYNPQMPGATWFRIAMDSGYTFGPFDYDFFRYIPYLALCFRPRLSAASITATDSFQLNAYYEPIQFDRDSLYADYNICIEYQQLGSEFTEFTSWQTLPEQTDNFADITRFAAKDLGNLVKLRIVAVPSTGGMPVESAWVTFSVEDYLKTILGDTNQSDETKRLCADILNYGAAAQNYFFGDDVSRLVNVNVDLSKATATDTPLPTLASFEGYGSEHAQYYGTSLLLRDQIIIRNYIEGEAPFVYDGTKIIGGVTYHYSDITGVNPLHFDTAFNTNMAGICVKYSVNYYIAKAYGQDGNPDALNHLLKMLYYYGCAATAYAQG